MQLLATHVHDEGVIHTIDKPIRTLADFKGLKLRSSNRWVTKLLAMLGAMPWEIVPSLKVHELVKFHKEVGAKGWEGPALLKSAKQLIERFDPN